MATGTQTAVTVNGMLRVTPIMLVVIGTAGRCAWAQQISGGQSHSMAVAVGGELVGWGLDSQNRHSGFPAGKTWALVSAGGEHSCGVTASGEGHCWGDDGEGQVSGLPSGKSWSLISVGRKYSCGVSASGEGLCWGANFAGQSSVPAGKTWTQISAGSSHTCGIPTIGEALCWGMDTDMLEAYSGQVSAIPSGKQWIQLSPGNYFTCGVTTNAVAYCWGNGAWPGMVSNNIPTGKTWVLLSSGGDHVCGVTASGEGICWGYNGNAGDGRITVPADKTWAQISAGGDHTCGVTTTGEALCWGSSSNSQATVPTTLTSVDLAPAGSYRPGKDNVPCPGGSSSNPGAITALGCRVPLVTVVTGSNFVSCALSLSTWVWTCSDGDGVYGHNEEATMRLTGPGKIIWEVLDTEKTFANLECQEDYIEISGSRHCTRHTEDDIPSESTVAADATRDVKWKTDNGGYPHQGFVFTFRPMQSTSQCPLGQEIRNSNCTLCSPGKHRSSLSSPTCQACAQGRYQDATGGIDCKPCSSGTYVNTTGSTLVSQCKECAKGTFAESAGSTTCAPCPKGSYGNTNRSATCKSCSPGTFANAVGSTLASQCLECIAGKFASVSRSALCGDCPEGRYTNASGRYVISSLSLQRALLIPRNHNSLRRLFLAHSRTHSTQCEPCPNRTFADTRGLARCKVCQAGTTYDGALLVSATSIPCVSCPAGTYRDHNRSETQADNECAKCGLGTSSAASASTCTFCAPGKVGRQVGG